MIPKNLIFIWLGSEIPLYGKTCINAFKKMNPEFNIILVHEPDLDNIKNQDVIDCFNEIKSDKPSIYKYMVERTYAKEHLSSSLSQKCTALSDALRFYLLNKYGGIYLDIDTFPVKPFDERLLSFSTGFMPKIYSSKTLYVDIFFMGFPQNCVVDEIGIKQYRIEIYDEKSLFFLFDKNAIHYITYDRTLIDALHSKYNALVNKFIDGKLSIGESILMKCFSEDYYIDHYKFKSYNENGLLSKKISYKKMNEWIQCQLQDKKPFIRNFTHFYDYDNYGQRLQCYALQKYIKINFNYDVYTYDKRNLSNQEKNNNMFFHAFERKCMNILDIDQFNLEKHYIDKIIIGGDQVLNIHENDRNCKDIYNYIVKNPKKNCFFYSGGIDYNGTINAKYIEKFSNKVFSFSTREHCINVESAQHIDPSFLLYDKWNKIAIQPKKCLNSKTYELEYIVKEGKCSCLKCYSDSNSITYIDENSGFKCPPDPREFLWLVKNCNVLHTNSFHGFVFGILFNIKKIICSTLQDNRILNLITLLDIKFDRNGNILNYEHIHENIIKEVNKAFNYFSHCFSYNAIQWCGYSNDKELHEKSTSGGICAELAKYMYKTGGVVYGGSFSDDFTKVKTICTKNINEYFLYLSKSKYNFCFMPNLKHIKNQLESNISVLYIGSPCQIHALYKYLRKNYKNLITVDFICRGYSSQSKLINFVRKIEEKYKMKVKGIDFRPNHKVDGIEVTLENSNIIKYDINVFNDFVFNTLDRCKNCRYLHGSISFSDITVSDFWENKNNKLCLNENFTPEYGCNKITINTFKGNVFFNEIKQQMNIQQI